MKKLVVFKFIEGSFEQGFLVTLQIGGEGQQPSTEITSKLPAAPEIPQYYEQWQATYRSLGLPARIKAIDAQVTNVSHAENCEAAGCKLLISLNMWLCSDLFRPLRERLLENVNRADEVRILLQTTDFYLQRLPWQLCELFERYSNSEVGLSAPTYVPPQSSSWQGQVKILAILGSSSGIDTQADRVLLEQLPNAQITFLVEPQRRQLNDELWKQHWDILFFAGHSSSQGEMGRFEINDTETLTVKELKYALKTVAVNGLKLAIFNSCDGLGLAQELSQLQIPQIVVMREPVPDFVAQEFLKYFLADFANGTPFYLAVRHARERLHGLEDRFPCATWLPVICQHPAVAPLVWPQRKKLPVKKGWMAGVAIASCSLLAAIGLAVANLQKPAQKLSDSPSTSQALDPFETRFSWGNRVLVKAHSTPEQEAGVKAMAAGDLTAAIAKFQDALKSERNNSETLIYLNNAVAAKAGRTLRIAASVPIGDNLNIAEEMLRGVAQAQDEVNRNGGINGALLQVEIANDDNDTEIAKEIAEKFVKDSLILAVVGHNASSVSLAVAPIYNQGSLVMVSPTSTSIDYSNLGKHIFRTVPSAKENAQQIANYAVKTARRIKFALCKDSRLNDIFAIEVIKAVQQDGGKVSSVPCDFANSSFNPGIFISSAIADGADSLVLAPSVASISRAIDVAKAAKGRLALFSDTTLYTFETLQFGQVDVNNMVVATVWHPSAVEGNAFISRAKQLWGGSVNWRTAMSYDAVIAIASALKQDSTRSGLQKVLSNPNFTVEGATGTVKFLPSGDRAHTPGIGLLVKVQPALSSPVGYEFVPVQP